MSITRKITYGSGFAFLVLLASGAAALWGAERLARTSAAVRHSDAVLATLHQTTAALVDTEDAARGYALTASERTLSRYERASGQSAQLIEQLAMLTRDDPTQQARVAALRDAAGRRLAISAELVATRRTGGVAAAAALTATGRGQAAMDEVRRLIDDIQSQVRRLLGVRLAADRSATRWLAGAVGLVTSAALVLAVVGTLLLVRSVTRPIERLTIAAERLGAGELDVHVDTDGDEFGRLGAVFNEMVRRRRETEQQLLSSNAFLDSLMRASPLAIVAIDADNVTTAWNPAAERMFGWTAEEALGRPLPSIPAGGQEAFGALRHRVYERGDIVTNLETERVRKDGSTFTAAVATAPRIDPGGHVLGMMAVIEDITERRQALRSLRASEERFRSIVEEVRDYAIFTLDAEGRIASWNRGAEAIKGFGADEVLGQPLGFLLAPESAGQDQILLATARLHGRASIEGWRRRKDGSRFWAHAVLTASHDHEGRLVGFTKVTQDLTEQRRNEEERTRLLAEQRLLADASAAMATTLDFEALAQRIAAALVPRLADVCTVEIVGDNGVIGRVAAAYRGLDADEAAAVEERRRKLALPVDADHAIARVVRSGRSFRLGAAPVATAADEAERVARAAMKLVDSLMVPLVARGRIFGCLSLGSRSADRYGDVVLPLCEELGRRAALALDNARLYYESQRATAARQELLAVVSHDLKNPLNAISLRAQILATHVPPSQAHHVASIRRAIKMMQHLIGTQLDAASLEAGRFSLDAELQPMRPVLEEVLALFAPVAADRELTLDSSCESADVVAWCDRQRIVQVLSNLVGNAIKFTPPGGRVEVHCRRIGDQMRWTVRDTGRGIAPDELPQLFQRFWRAPGAGPSGTGLGLYIARRIVEAHGGRMWAESQVGAGTTFSFTLPLVPPLGTGRSLSRGPVAV